MTAAVALQKAIYDALTAAGITAHDRVPPTPAFPYVTIDDAQLLDDGDTCETDRFEAFVDCHVWSRAVGSVEAKTLAHSIRDALTEIGIASEWRVTAAEFRSSRHFRDSDGLTSHGVVSFRFLLEKQL